MIGKVLLAFGAMLATAHAAPVVIQNGFIQAGVSDFGTLGSNGTNPPGIHFDPTGTGNFTSGDFLTPGDPFEGFYITANGGTYSQFSNNANDTTFNMNSPVLGTPTTASWTSTTADGTLAVTNTYSLGMVGGRQGIEMVTIVTNLDGVPLTGLQFLRTLDPDQDDNIFNTNDTLNSVLNWEEACGTGPFSGTTVCIGNIGGGSFVAGVSEDWSEIPADYLAGLNDGDGDFAIGLAYAFGDLAAGGSATFSYFYAFDVRAVPEPLTAALFGAGLAGMGALRRRKK